MLIFSNNSNSSNRTDIKSFYTHPKVSIEFSCLGGVMVNILAIRPKVCSFKHGRDDRFFKGDKNPHHTFLQRVSEAGGPML
jgi:hypothetical protein